LAKKRSMYVINWYVETSIRMNQCVFRSNRPPNPEQTGRVVRDKATGGRSEATLEFFS